MHIKDDTLITRNEMLSSEHDSETVMMSLEEQKYFGMNKTGSYIWRILQKPLTFKSLCLVIASDFEVREEQCADEIRPFIEEMYQAKIITLQ